MQGADGKGQGCLRRGAHEAKDRGSGFPRRRADEAEDMKTGSRREAYKGNGGEGETYRWFAAVSFSCESCSKLSKDCIRSLRAINLRSAIATSFLMPEFCSTSGRCTTVSCSRLRSRNIIFFCCARLLDVRSTLLYCSRVSSREISSSTT